MEAIMEPYGEYQPGTMPSQLGLFRFAWEYVKTRPGKLSLAFTGAVLAAVEEALYPVVWGKFVDFLNTHDVNAAGTVRQALVYLGWVMGMGLFYWLMKYIGWFPWADIVASSMRRMTEDALFRVQHFSADWHASSFGGATVTKIKRGMRGLQAFIDTIYYNFTPLIVIMVGVIVTTGIKYGSFALLLALGAMVYITMSVILSLRYVLPVKKKEVESDSRSSGILADIITCNGVVKSFAKEKEEERRFHKIMREFEMWSLLSWKRNEYIGIVQTFVMTMVKLLFIGGGLYLWIKRLFSVGDVVFIYGSYQILANHLRDVGTYLRNLQSSANDMAEVAEFQSIPLEREAGIALKLAKGEIAFENVTFSYQSELGPVFKNLSVIIKPGEKVALVGPSGSGKTTFVKLLERFYEVERGRILIDGQDIAQASLKSLRGSLVVVPQDPILFHRTLEDNIAYGGEEPAGKKVIEAAKLAYIHDFIQSLPGGYKTFVGERGVKLSGGERQRVAIARALYAASPILILDEATSSLDAESEQYIQKGIENAMKGRTTIVIAHRLSTIRKVDRILVFDKGTIVEQGTHARLLKAGGLYAHLYKMQSGGFLGEK